MVQRQGGPGQLKFPQHGLRCWDSVLTSQQRRRNTDGGLVCSENRDLQRHAQGGRWLIQTIVSAFLRALWGNRTDTINMYLKGMD